MAKKKSTTTFKVPDLDTTAPYMDYLAEGDYVLRVQDISQDIHYETRGDESTPRTGSSIVVRFEVYDVESTTSEYPPDSLMGVSYSERFYFMEEGHPKYSNPGNGKSNKTMGEQMCERAKKKLRTMLSHLVDLETGDVGVEVTEGGEFDAAEAIGRVVLGRVKEREDRREAGRIQNEVSSWAKPEV